MIRALAACLVVATFGCAITTDLAYLAAGPNHAGQVSSAALGTGRIEHARTIAIAPGQGFVCRDVETPYVTASRVVTRVRNPNGFKLPMQVFTALEAGITGVALSAREMSCERNGCEDRGTLYLYLIPLFADIAWGAYRSFTIHNEIVRSSEVSWPGGSSAIQSTTFETRCPPGTEIPLHAGADRLVLHVGERGHVVEAELDLALRFVLEHPQFSVGGDLRFDASGVAGLVAYARAKLAPPIAVAPPPSEPPPRPPATIVVPTSVCVENPLAEFCVHTRPPPPPPPPPSRR